ncbi:NAD-dependent protein deacetylase [Fundidesulfovibrio magnetotacticus]|uniref:protein acetyllysine N-acetyltransferase n=1 Tax=Fundidesulfovibrio magnetotacticus TaxID=2730080 RepID=A0A6V8LI80_9BACT|nr:NAD-dependent deacylase [Fundidesulfovibrio magnetotacticus]GFK92423.1 NAD-dependent protein deacetylase [Fundidesulfovibrio magnetotacticus]
MKEAVERIARLWPSSGKVLVLTGAGISVPSGIPDFRSPGGLWSRYDPMRVATAEALANSPAEAWRFILDARDVMAAARPNAAHEALAELERAGLIEGIVTQNIDGLHQRAGSLNVVEFHGTMSGWRCNGCQAPKDATRAMEVTPETAPWLCERCGAVVRPDVVFFGEPIPLDALDKSGQLASGAELALIVGTSCEVAPANVLPQLVRQQGGRLAEINLAASRLAPLCDAAVAAGAEEALPLLARLLLDQ